MTDRALDCTELPLDHEQHEAQKKAIADAVEKLVLSTQAAVQRRLTAAHTQALQVLDAANARVLQEMDDTRARVLQEMDDTRAHVLQKIDDASALTLRDNATLARQAAQEIAPLLNGMIAPPSLHQATGTAGVRVNDRDEGTTARGGASSSLRALLDLGVAQMKARRSPTITRWSLRQRMRRRSKGECVPYMNVCLFSKAVYYALIRSPNDLHCRTFVPDQQCLHTEAQTGTSRAATSVGE